MYTVYWLRIFKGSFRMGTGKTIFNFNSVRQTTRLTMATKTVIFMTIKLIYHNDNDGNKLYFKEGFYSHHQYIFFS